MTAIREWISPTMERMMRDTMVATRHPIQRGARSIAGVCSLALGVMYGLTGCADNKPTAPSLRAPSATLSLLSASPMNAIMAVGDSFQVTISAQAIDGSPLTTFDSVRYVLNSIVDTARIRVSPTGMITGLTSSTSTPVLLNVYAYKGGVGAADQIVIQVTETAIAGATMSIQPVAPDTARVTIGNYKQIVPVIQNGSGASVSDVQMRLYTNVDDATRVSCFPAYFPNQSAAFSISSAVLQQKLQACTTASYPNYIQGQAPGTAWIHAKALVYGATLEDSVLYTVSNVTMAYVGVQNQNLHVLCFSCNVTIAPGGSVAFENALSTGLAMGMAVTFDDPASATVADPPSTSGGSTGNVSALQPRDLSTRTFLVPGTYGYTIQLSNAPPPFTNSSFRGSIVVQ